MRMRLVTRAPFEREEYLSIVDVDTLDDLTRVVHSCVSQASATLNDLPIVDGGQVKLYVYNRPTEVIEYLQGIRKEL